MDSNAPPSNDGAVLRSTYCCNRVINSASAETCRYGEKFRALIDRVTQSPFAVAMLPEFDGVPQLHRVHVALLPLAVLQRVDDDAHVAATLCGPLQKSRK